MARIPEEEIERLKREVSIERLAEARGVKAQAHGADLIGLCPFHEDHIAVAGASVRRKICGTVWARAEKAEA